jgi:hypothetical protein
MAVQRSSETIGAIAAALAKAQTELTNPEKSLVGIIGASSPREPGRSFRYAPLSSGLDIARKSLGRHSIAIVQTTAIDKEAGLVQLNTALVHSSGEWVSSQWPVCRVGDTASPQRMGAALTYARRYALFTLVGIAGEDDLDAPDLVPASKQEGQHPTDGHSRVELREDVAADSFKRRREGKRLHSNPKTLLDVDASAVLRDKLSAELGAIATMDESLAWAQRSLSAKNMLTSAGAEAIEQAFRTKMHAFERTEVHKPIVPAPSGDGPNKLDDGPRPNAPGSDAAVTPSRTIIGGPNAARMENGQNATTLLKPLRKRDKAHRDFVCTQPCLVCGRKASDAHHVRFGQPRALGLKVSDEFTVPLCRVHHRDLHRRSDEKKWWEAVKIEPLEIAQRLWLATRGKSE